MLSVFRMADSQNQNEHEVVCVAELASHAAVVMERRRVAKIKAGELTALLFIPIAL